MSLELFIAVLKDVFNNLDWRTKQAVKMNTSLNIVFALILLLEKFPQVCFVLRDLQGKIQGQAVRVLLTKVRQKM